MASIRSLLLGTASLLCGCAARPNSEVPRDTPRLPAVRDEILRMANEDQEARRSVIEKADEPGWQRVEQIDGKNTSRLKTIVAQYGWPGRSLVGEDGAHAAWLLVQHAAQDLMFQKDCLEKMKQSFKGGEVSARDLAYLVDRVAVAENKKQLYGTQFIFIGRCDDMKPQPIEDEQHVDERRKSVGLTTLAEYGKQIRRTYCRPETGFE